MKETTVISAVPPARRSFALRPRFWIGVVVASLWGTMMVFVWRNEHARLGANLREMGVSREIILSTWQNVDQWTAIERRGEWLGGGRLSIQRDAIAKEDETESKGRPAPPDFFLFSRVRLRFPVLGWNLPLDLQMRVRMNSAFEIQALVSALTLAGNKANLEAFVEAGSLFYRLRTGGIELKDAATTETVHVAAAPAAPGAFTIPDMDLCGRSPLKGPIILSDALIPILSRSDKFKPGAQWTTRVANPLFGQLDQIVQVKVEGREEIQTGSKKIEAWKTTERLGQVATTAWYDDQGQSVRRELPNGLVMTLSNGKDVLSQEPLLRRDLPMEREPDRAWIRAHLDPSLEGKPLEALLPQLPGM